MKKLNKLCKSKWFPLLLFAGYFCLPLLMYLSFYRDNIIPISGDAIGFFAVRIFSNHSLLSGELPLWNPLLENGIPWAGDFYGVFYPLHLLLGILSLKDFVYFYYAFHLALGGVFFYLFLKETGIRQELSLAVSLIYLCSTHLGGLRKSHIILIMAMVFLPVVMYWAEKFIHELKWKYLGYAALFMAFDFFSGAHIQQIVYTDLAAGLYLVIRLLLRRVSIWKIFMSLGGWVLTYVGLIALQLLPAMEIMQYYSRSGATKSTYELFVSYSMHPIKLLMLLFPHIFGDDLYQPMGVSQSSEMDIEIFLGTVTAVLVIYGIIRFWQKSAVRIYLLFMAGAVAVAACAHIPFVGKMLYHIPLINGFRVPSRTLFIFIFFSFCLFALTLELVIQNLERDQEAESGRLYKYAKVWLLSSAALYLAVLITQTCSLQGEGINSGTLLEKTEQLTKIFSNVIFGSAVLFLLLWLYRRITWKYLSCRRKNMALLLVLTVSILLETREFAAVTQGTQQTDAFRQDSVLYKIKGEENSGKVLLAQPQITGTYESEVAYSRNLEAEVPSVNAYVSLNNPGLFNLLSYNTALKPGYNFSGLYTGFEDIYNNLILDNDILSMLGVRYIIDPFHYIERNQGKIVKEFKDDGAEYSLGDAVIPSTGGGMYVYSQDVSLEEYTYYKIKLEIDSENTEEVYVDFFGDNFDNPAQQYNFTVSRGEAVYEILLNSGDCRDTDLIQWRFVCTPTGEIRIKAAEMVRQQPVWDKQVYSLYDGDSSVYENKNVKDIIYPSARVCCVKDVKDIYNGRRSYRMDRDSFIEGADGEETVCAPTVVDSIKRTNNTASARVVSEGTTFINFSDNYYPGWKVYVDGEKKENYRVNGLIQGTFVEPGTHIIEFRFQPVSVYAGAFVSLATLILLVIYLVFSRIKTKKIWS